MSGITIGYIRVSTDDQNPERQLHGFPCDKIFVEYASGKDMRRPELQKMLDFARNGDTIIVHSMDRLARNVDDLRLMIRFLNGKNVKVKFQREGWTFSGESDPYTMMLLTVIGAVAEFEREVMLERQREGIRLAKLKGKFKGRQAVITGESYLLFKERVLSHVPIQRLCKQFGISRPSAYKYMKQALKEEGLDFYNRKLVWDESDQSSKEQA